MIWWKMNAHLMLLPSIFRLFEAVKNIPDDLREAYPQIEWRKIAGLRDFIAHAYFMLDDEIIWDVIQTKLQPLEECILLIKDNL
jgi:uncharacterized protein with HEPN domain